MKVESYYNLLDKWIYFYVNSQYWNDPLFNPNNTKYQLERYKSKYYSWKYFPHQLLQVFMNWSSIFTHPHMGLIEIRVELYHIYNLVNKMDSEGKLSPDLSMKLSTKDTGNCKFSYAWKVIPDYLLDDHLKGKRK